MPGIGELMEGLAAYTANHYTRLRRLQRSAYLLDYTLASMNVLLPVGDGVDASECKTNRRRRGFKLLKISTRHVVCRAAGAGTCFSTVLTLLCCHDCG